eukprot:358187-Pleurochrysis_carterae.AAC.1
MDDGDETCLKPSCRRYLPPLLRYFALVLAAHTLENNCSPVCSPDEQPALACVPVCMLNLLMLLPYTAVCIF